MDQKTKVDVLVALSATHRSQFDERRRYEWKVLLSTLGVYATSIAAKVTSGVSLPRMQLILVFVWVSFVGLGIITSIYLYYLHRANNINKAFAQAAEEGLMQLSELKEFSKVKSEIDKSSTLNWSLNWQVTTILLFSVMASLVLTAS